MRTAAKEKRKEVRTVLILLARDELGERRVLLHRRPPKGLLVSLWELPNEEGELTAEQAVAWATRQGFVGVKAEAVTRAKHLFSHVEWTMRGFLMEGERREASRSLPDTVWADAAELKEKYALPSAFRAYSRLLPQWLEEGLPLSLFENV